MKKAVLFMARISLYSQKLRKESGSMKNMKGGNVQDVRRPVINYAFNIEL